MLDQVCRLLADHDAGSVGVAGDQRRHDRRVGDAQPRDAVNPELVVDHRPGVIDGAHLARPDVVVDGVGVVANDALPVGVGVGLVVLAERVRVAEELGANLLQRSHVGDGQTLLDPGDQYLDV